MPTRKAKGVASIGLIPKALKSQSVINAPTIINAPWPTLTTFRTPKIRLRPIVAMP